MRKIGNSCFSGGDSLKPSADTTTRTYSISGIKNQYEQVAMAMHCVTMETTYIPKSELELHVLGPLT